jgi:hypothetical protein
MTSPRYGFSRLLERGLVVVRRPWRGPHRQPVQVATGEGAEEGDATPRRGWPPSRSGGRFPDWRAARARRRSPERRNPLNEPMLTPAGRSQDGRRFVPPGKRPSAGVAAGRGVSDPARVLQARPQGRPRGRSRPDVSVRVCWGMRAFCCGTGVRVSAGTSAEFFEERTAKLLRFCRDFPAGVRPTSSSESRLVCRRSGSQFSGRAWAGQGSASPLRALDPPGALPMRCSYRSDGTTGSTPAWFARRQAA